MYDPFYGVRGGHANDSDGRRLPMKSGRELLDDMTKEALELWRLGEESARVASHAARERHWSFAGVRYRSPLWVRGNVGRLPRETFNYSGMVPFDYMQAWKRR